MNLAIGTVGRTAFDRKSAAVRFALSASLGLLFLVAGVCDRASAAGDPAPLGVFVGSSPGGISISQLLHIPAEVEPPIRWELTLYKDAKSKSPAGYKLRCNYTWVSENVNARRVKPERWEREGTWKLAKGTKFNSDAAVYELDGLLSLGKVDENILQLLNPDRSLMVGDGGWSYTLNRESAAEKPGPVVPLNAPSVSYTLSPLATGPTVLGVFEGRTPAIGIAQVLNIPLDAHRLKCKWRVTLFQDPETKSPTTYKVEGSFYRGDRREGNWSIIRGTDTDPNATVYRLAPARSEDALLLLKGDDNVLFFLDQKRKPLVGHADFSYALNRRTIADASTASSTARSK